MVLVCPSLASSPVVPIRSAYPGSPRLLSTLPRCTGTIRLAMAAAFPTPTPRDLSSAAHILEPIREKGKDVFLYFLPGAFTASTHYVPILEGIQTECSFRLWVGLLDVGDALIDAGTIEMSFDGVLARAEKMGFPMGSAIFMGGHSWGGWESRSFAMKKAHGYIQLASCFHTNPDNLVQYPKPVLTISGELDGQITLAPLVKHAGEVYAFKDELGDYFVNAIKPVIIVPGMNHAQFSHGIPNRQRGDFDALIPQEEARAVTIRLISSFLTVHMTDNDPAASSQALSVLSDAVKQTQDRYRTFWEAIEDQGRGAKQMQIELAGLPSGIISEHNIGVVQHQYKDNFIYSKPSIHVPTEQVTIHTFLSPAGKYNLLKNLWIKMKSREAMSAAFCEDSQQVEEPRSIGATLNERIFSEALALIPEDARKKYEEHGKKLRFIEDAIITTKVDDWIESEPVLKPAEDGSGYVDVQSPAIITPLQGISQRFAGMHYVKLLTVAKAMEWILMDCHRKSPSPA